jgi:RHS repeat-associated protein
LKEVSTGGNNTYGYDGDNHRVREVESGGAAVYYVRSTVLGQVAWETKSAQAVYHAYVYGPQGKLLAQQSTDGQFYWVHTDHLGSGRKLTNSSGTLKYRGEFDPHGQALYEWSDVSTELNSRKFTGYERDAATGLDYAEARMYTSSRGRFLQADPKSLKSANLGEPQSLNRYSYVGNDPINFVDPTGLFRYEPPVDPIGDFLPHQGGNGNGDTLHPRDRGDYYDPNGGGSGTAQPQLGFLSNQDLSMLGDAFNLLIQRLSLPTESCLNNVINRLSNLQGFDAGAFLGFLQRGFNAYDGANTTLSAVGTLVAQDEAPNEYVGRTVQELFARGTRDAITVSIPGTDILTVFFNPSTLLGARMSSGGTGQVAALWFHEAIHGFARTTGSENLEHENVLTAFEIPEDAESGEIHNYIGRHCF